MQSQTKARPIRLAAWALTVAALCLWAGACKKAPMDVQGALITGLKGQVSVTRPDGAVEKVGSDIIDTKGAILAPGTTIETTPDGHADLAFTSGVLVRLAGGGRLTVAAARVLTDKDFSQVQMRLDSGRVFVRSPKLGRASRLAVTTPTAIASVRGTDFLVKTDSGGTTALVGEGLVEVTDEKVGEVKAVEPGSKAEVSPSGAVVVKPQTEDEKKELSDISQGIQGISEKGREQIRGILQTFEDQKKLIRQALDEQKRSNQELLEAQKGKDREMVKGQTDRDREMLRDQIRRDQEMLDKVRGEAKQNADAVKDKGRADQDAVKGKTQGDMDNIKKKSGTEGIDKTRSELDRLKKMQ